MSPKSLFFNVPGHGHVNPSLPLIAELSRRGHHITYFITDGYRAKVEVAGALFHPYAAIEDNYFEIRELDGSRPQKVACELMKTSEEILPELLETARDISPDYILFDGMCPWGYYVARILKVPAVASLSLMPPISPPPKALMSRTTLSFIIPILLRDFGKGLEANRRSQALGKKYGVRPLGPTSLLSAEGDISISYTSATFQPYSDTVPKSVRFVGRTVDKETDDNPILFQHVRGRPLIYISLGTLNNKDKGFFELCIETFANRDEYVVLTTGNQFAPESFGSLPENVSIHSWVAQAAVLKRAALFITHGGLNSIHDGLYFGVPLLLCPQQGEQTFNASRVVELGAGLMLARSQFHKENILSKTTQLLKDGCFKEDAQRIGETFRTAGGMKKAADEIEALLQKSSASRI